MALGMGLGGCGDGANEAVSSESVVEWTVPVPEFTARPLDELWGDVLSPPGPGPEELSLLEIPAAVFDNNSGRPRTSEPAWQELITLACDPEGVVQAALANGWDIVVTGFVDSVGGHGPGTRNDELQLERAEAAEAELLVSCEAAGAAIPSERVLVARGGIAPDDTRKVVVTLTRNQEDDQ
jgi:hypothetical protein